MEEIVAAPSHFSKPRMARPGHSQRRPLSTMAPMAVFVLVLSLHAGSVAAMQCRGKQNYKLKVSMKWDKRVDIHFSSGNAAGYIIVVSHSESYKLFDTQKNLPSTVKHLVQNNKVGPLFAELKAKKNAANPTVHDYEYVNGAGPQDIAYLNIAVDGDRGLTWVSLLGVLLKTPDYFFALPSIPMCGEGNFTDRFPEVDDRPTIAYDAGFDDRERFSDKPRPVQKSPKVDKRVSLHKTLPYAYVTIEKGTFKRVFPFWKILVIVGVLATAILVAFICLYPYCCKKQMLDVPVPLQDESQWAT